MCRSFFPYPDFLPIYHTFLSSPFLSLSSLVLPLPDLVRIKVTLTEASNKFYLIIKQRGLNIIFFLQKFWLNKINYFFCSFFGIFFKKSFFFWHPKIFWNILEFAKRGWGQCKVSFSKLQKKTLTIKMLWINKFAVNEKFTNDWYVRPTIGSALRFLIENNQLLS